MRCVNLQGTSSVFKNWYKVKKRVLIKVELIYFFK